MTTTPAYPLAWPKKRNLIGMDLMMVMAAAVELTEPSP